MMGAVARRGRGRGSEDGAAAVEFALVVPVLVLLLFGIISYGYMLSVRQAITQATAEGARAGAVTQPASGTSPEDAAIAAVNRSLDGFGLTCASPGMQCEAAPPAACDGGSARCVSVTVNYAYAAHDPLDIPFVPMPENLRFTARAEVN